MSIFSKIKKALNDDDLAFFYIHEDEPQHMEHDDLIEENKRLRGLLEEKKRKAIEVKAWERLE